MQYTHQSQILLIAISCTHSRTKLAVLNIECFLLLKIIIQSEGH